jgi:serine-type D-Ala-D-Ala carboxypeptidase (penicillin-binding protein 5/6)
MSRFLAAALAVAALLGAPPARAFDTSGTAALIVDHATGMVLLEKNADEPLPPASMSKLMTLYMLFEAIRDGRVTPETEFVVSSRAQSKGGSRMFLEAGTTVPVMDLIRGIIVQSGNDACVVVAEGLYGSEETFARAMTERARELGLSETTLKNSSGWPEPGHVMSARDIVKLSRRLIDEFPEYYTLFDETEYTWNNITQQNRNPLLTLGIGADGLKTGHTSEAGYSLAGSAVQDGQRIVFVVNGLESQQIRRIETEQMVRWAYGAFQPVQFFEAGETVANARVWLGDRDTVPLVAPQPVRMLVPHDARPGVAAEIVYSGPLEAPLAAGDPVAELVVRVPGWEDPARFALVAGEDVPVGGFLRRIEAAATIARDRAFGLIAFPAAE